MKRKNLILLVIFFSIVLFSVSVLAEGEKAGEEINWQVISNGGTEGSSANYGLQGTVSEIAIGEGSSANYGLKHGFWQIFEGTTYPCQGKCGDANGDAKVNVSDAVYIINYVFVGGGAPLPVLACGDANTDGKVNVSDAVYLINFVFTSGSAPGNCSPGDPDWDGYDCCEFTM